MKVVVGIGNPGAEYEGTRHNAGFVVIDRLAARLKVKLRPFGSSCVSAKRSPFGEDVYLVKPTIYVNRSGTAAAEVLARGEGSPADLLVLCDDINLPPGKIRIRAGGSAGGHNGLASIIGALGTEAFARLRIGVGLPPPGVDSADYVLKRPSPEESKLLAEACERAGDAVLLWLKEGHLDACMNRYNT